jgi:3'-5' exoribonuclease
MKREADFVKNIAIGGKVNTFFAVAKKDFKTKKNGDPYVAVMLADKTGTVNGVIWDDVAAAKAVLNEHDIVWVAGDVGDYSGSPQLTVRTVRGCKKEEYDIGDLIKSVENLDRIEADIKGLLGGIQDQRVKALAAAIWKDAEFMEKFRKAPGGLRWHHSYFGGLMQHTWEVMELCNKACDLHPEADRDLCILGAFIHDFGKVFELSYDLTFDYTDAGRLIGHIIQGNDFIVGKMKGIKEFPEELAVHIEHILLSHQGEYEQRSPVLPQTLEACIVYHSDNLDSQANAFKSVIYGPREEGQKWSKWLTIINRSLLLKEEKK